MKIFLKFSDEQEAISILSDYRYDGEWLTASHTHDLHVVGTICRPTGVTLIDSDGFEYPEQAPIPGYHINMVVQEVPEYMTPYLVEPANPAVVFG